MLPVNSFQLFATVGLNPVSTNSMEGTFEPILRNTVDQGWLVLLLVLIFALLAYVRAVYSKHLRELVNAFASNRFVRQMMREEKAFTSRPAMALSIVFVVSISLFLTLLVKEFDGSPIGQSSGWVLFGNMLWVTGIYYILKLSMATLGGHLLKVRNVSSEYIFNLLLFWKVLGLALLPFIIAASFFVYLSPPFFLIAGSLTIAIFYLVRLFKEVYNTMSTTNFSKFYIILYFCTLEILPLVFIFGWIKRFAQ